MKTEFPKKKQQQQQKSSTLQHHIASLDRFHIRGIGQEPLACK